MSSHVKKAAKRKPKRHPAPLHHVLHAYNIKPDRIEKIRATRLLPKWHRPFKTRIAPDRETAIQEEEADRADVRIYSDGSGIENQIGAAAVLYRGNRKKGTLKYRLGSAKHHTVYEGELVGMGLGAELLRKERNIKSATLYVDNQAGIQGTDLFRAASGHYLVDHFHNQIERILRRTPGLKLMIRWIPGHEGIQGNEAVDEAAKEAAQDGSSHDAVLPARFKSKKRLPFSKSALKQAFNEGLKIKTSGRFEKSPRCATLRRIDPSAPSSNFRKLTDVLPRRQASLLVQLRTGHAPLNKHLHRINCADSPLCPACEEGEESVFHFLMRCPAYERQRRAMQFQLQRGAHSIQNLLTSPTAIKPLFQFIANTHRFEPTFGNVALPESTS